VNQTDAIELSDTFGRTAKLLGQVLDDALAQHGRTLHRGRALHVVADAPGPARLADIMAQVGVGQATASTLVDGLVRDGLIARQPDPSDGRAMRLVATAAGATAAKQWRAAYVRLAERMFGEVAEEDRAAFVRVLAQLESAARAQRGR
jgi:DNA-binding MarR family transcriptional regulator